MRSGDPSQRHAADVHAHPRREDQMEQPNGKEPPGRPRRAARVRPRPRRFHILYPPTKHRHVLVPSAAHPQQLLSVRCSAIPRAQRDIHALRVCDCGGGGSELPPGYGDKARCDDAFKDETHERSATRQDNVGDERSAGARAIAIRDEERGLAFRGRWRCRARAWAHR